MNDMMPINYERRVALNEELHIHPYEPLTPPEKIVLFVMLVNAEERLMESQHLQILLSEFEEPGPNKRRNHIRYDLGKFRLKIEMHQEFTKYKFVWRTTDNLPAEPFQESIHSLLPKGWLLNLPGQAIVAMEMSFLPFPVDASTEILIERYAHLFDNSALAASQVGRSKGIVLTDFKINENGLTRMMVFSKAALPSQNGRLLFRLVEVETYRMMALLAYPEARKLLSALQKIEDHLSQLTHAIASSDGDEDNKLLEELSTLAATVESLVASNYRRFSASRAYFDVLFKRLNELQEEPIKNIPSLGGILERRLEPARSTCESAWRWLDQISLRLSHTSELLQTRIDVQRENQNQELLVAMNKRLQIQLRLQETAEILSIAIVPYYAVNLLGYIIEEINNIVHWDVEPLMIKAISAPIIALFVFLFMIKMRKRKDLDV